MKALLAQIALGLVLILIVLNIAEAPVSKYVYTEIAELAGPDTITVVFTGDVMMGRNVELLMNMKGYDHPFASTKEIFDRGDMVVINLEGPIPHDHVRTRSGEMSFSFAPHIPEVLKRNGVDVVSLANNHTHDKGSAVYKQTIESLQAFQIESFGHPLIQSAEYAEQLTVDGVSFILLGFNATYPSFEIEEAVTAVSEVRALHPDGVIIASMHWGDEYELVSNKEQKSISERLHDAGVGLIIGAHPHVTQEISCKGINRCTLFSLGNFIFDQYFSKDVEQGLVAYVTLSNNSIEQIEVVPIEGNHSQPRIMADNKAFLQSLIDRSSFTDTRLSTSTETLLLKP